MALAAAVVLSGMAAWGGDGSEVREVVFETWPPGARVELETSAGNRFLGLSGQPVHLDLSGLGSSFSVRFLRDGYQVREERILHHYFDDHPRFPESGPLKLEADNVLVEGRDAVLLHPLASIAAAVAAIGAGVLLSRRRRRTRGLLERASRLESMVVPSGATDVWVGRRLGRYRLVQSLGQGGMSLVYRAVPEDTLDESDAVAIKIMRPEAAHDAEFRARFNREVRICQVLDHPSIVRVIDWGEDEETLYLVMELVVGGTLRGLIPRQGMPLPETRRVLRPIFEAVDYAHRKDIVHRDLKPENIMLTADGRVKVMDFGLARGHQFSTVTLAGSALGTPAYMSPEQVTSKLPDGRSDQYSLGIVAYEMLTGRVPFDDEVPINILLKQMTEKPAPLRDRRPDLSPAVEAVVLRMMSKSPADRFDNLLAALDALDAAVR